VSRDKKNKNADNCHSESVSARYFNGSIFVFPPCLLDSRGTRHESRATLLLFFHSSCTVILVKLRSLSGAAKKGEPIASWRTTSRPFVARRQPGTRQMPAARDAFFYPLRG